VPGRRLSLEVVVPLRWDDPDEQAHRFAVDELTAYLRQLSTVADVTVVDGSSDTASSSTTAPGRRWILPSGTCDLTRGRASTARSSAR